jgi:hypothetical protein
MDRSPPTWPVAAGSLALGFAVAEATGIRAAGGVVLVLGAGWCALRWRERAGLGRAALLLVLYAAAFAASHVLGDVVGAWPAVALVAGAVGMGAWLGADLAPAGRRTAPIG